MKEGERGQRRTSGPPGRQPIPESEPFPKPECTPGDTTCEELGENPAIDTEQHNKPDEPLGTPTAETKTTTPTQELLTKTTGLTGQGGQTESTLPSEPV